MKIGIQTRPWGVDMNSQHLPQVQTVPWLVVEQDETKLAPTESARVSRQYLASLKL